MWQELQIILYPMASLRTAFLKAKRWNSNTFCPLFAYLQSLLAAPANLDQLEHPKQEPKIQQGKKQMMSDSSALTRDTLAKEAHYHIHLHINSFSRLLDSNSNDFKDCKDVVHILQILDEQQCSDIHLWELETNKSLSPSQHERTTAEQSEVDVLDLEDFEGHLAIFF